MPLSMQISMVFSSICIDILDKLKFLNKFSQAKETSTSIWKALTDQETFHYNHALDY